MFKTFPEFSKLTLQDKDAYNALIKQWPPYSEFAFSTMMTWWNVLDTAAVSMLNDNLVLSYWLPGDETNTGLSLVGTTKIDESVCTIFDYQRDKDEFVRLVHVPEFVVSCLHYPELFRFKGEREFDEYVLATEVIGTPPTIPPFLERRAKRFLTAHRQEDISVCALDLNQPHNKQLLLVCARAWAQKGLMNTLPKATEDSLYLVIIEAEKIGMEVMCIFVQGRLSGYFLYEMQHSGYALANYGRIDPELPGGTEYLIYECLKWLAERGVRYANFDFDLGMPHTRAHQLNLSPVNYLRKYTIKPA